MKVACAFWLNVNNSECFVYTHNVMEILCEPAAL